MTSQGSGNDEQMGLWEERVLVNPHEVFVSYLGSVSGAWRHGGPRLGQISIGLQIETRRRLIAGAVGNSLLHLSKEEVVSVLQTLLVDLGLWDEVQEWYVRLLDWQDQGRRRHVPIADADGVYAGHVAPLSDPEGPGHGPAPEQDSVRLLEGPKTADLDELLRRGRGGGA